MIVLNMALEQIMFIAAHDNALGNFDAMNTSLHGPPMPSSRHSSLAKCEEGGQVLLNIYKTCFENCHALQLRALEEQHFVSLQKSFGPVSAKFFAMVGQATRVKSEYADTMANLVLESVVDPAQLFDRQLARLLRMPKN